ncbi:hypothetical protein [Labrys wisconsinensis]|uniref:Uncharacterized protein n=1 Tax=Labrys wisconsinensis TaxID=425677 RepID=A0ABU0JBP2_9HYPH|nr:hypothetical protein [Labrys wisconsinensis]MDQ0471702.1 hypothetical protein [Labrys wisconsinensis]
MLLRATALFLFAVLAAPALAQTQDRGCDIETSSYVVVKPPTPRPPTGPVVAVPQTPCPTLPDQWDGAVGPIGVGIEIKPPRRGHRPAEREAGVTD